MAPPEPPVFIPTVFLVPAELVVTPLIAPFGRLIMAIPTNMLPVFFCAAVDPGAEAMNVPAM